MTLLFALRYVFLAVLVVTVAGLALLHRSRAVGPRDARDAGWPTTPAGPRGGRR